MRLIRVFTYRDAFALFAGFGAVFGLILGAGAGILSLVVVMTAHPFHLAASFWPAVLVAACSPASSFWPFSAVSPAWRGSPF